MPQQKQVPETYWCPGGWPWEWFDTCTRTVTKWCYNFSWIKETGYGVVSYLEACEGGKLYTWYEPSLNVFGSQTHPGGERCFDSPRSNGGKCDPNETGSLGSPLARDEVDKYATVWVLYAGPAFVARHGLTSEQYQQHFDDLVPKGYRPICISGYVINGEARFAAIWELTGGPAWQARHQLTSEQYQQQVADLLTAGFRPKLVSGYVINSEARYAAVWEAITDSAWAARHELTSEQYQQQVADLLAEGLRPACVSGYVINGEARFAAVWETVGDSGWAARHELTSEQYQQQTEDFLAAGLRPTSVSGYVINGEDRYIAIWEATSLAWKARHGLTAEQYQQQAETFTSEGYRPKWVSGHV